VFRQALGLRQKYISVPVVLTGTVDQLQVQAATEFLIASVYFNGDQSTETIAVPWDLLRDCEGRRDDPVTIERIPDGRVSASFEDHGVPVIKWYDPREAPVAVEGFPIPAERCRENYPELLRALQHAAEITSDSPTRYALDHLRLRGSDGSIAATDGRHLLVQAGFEFLWDDDVLVPSMPVFGNSELQGHPSILVGKQADWVTLIIGPWTFGMKVNQEGRFPKVDDNIRRPDTAMAALNISDGDAKFLSDVLPRLPSPDSVHNPVTLELNGSIAFRARPEEPGKPTEVVLRQSTWNGSDVRINSDRRFLSNALRFGLRELSIFKPDTPLLCHDLRRSYVWMPLPADQAIPPTADCVRIESPACPAPVTVPTTIHRRIQAPMPTTNRLTRVNGNHTNGQSKPNQAPDGQTGESLNAIDQACQLRETLHTAAQQAGALVRELKKDRRRTKSLRSTLLSLRQLQAIDA